MALTEFTQALVEVKMEDYLKENRPPEDIRPQLDIGYRIENQSVYIYEIRPHWKTEEIMHTDVAKTTFSKVDNFWKIYWMRKDSKWHRYDPAPSSDSLDNWLKLVDEDEHCCFWG